MSRPIGRAWTAPISAAAKDVLGPADVAALADYLAVDREVPMSGPLLCLDALQDEGFLVSPALQDVRQ